MCEGQWRVNLEMLLAVCRERGHSYTEVPVDNLGNGAHGYLRGFIDYLKASDHDLVPVRHLIGRSQLTSVLSLQCRSGCGCCLRLAENKIDGFLEKELPGVQEGRVL